MVEKMILVEFRDEAESLIPFLQQESVTDFQIIPLSLPARLVLIRAGIPFQDTLPFFDSRAHARCMEQSEEWLKLLESIGGKGPDTVTMQEIVFCIRPAVNYLLWLVETMHQALKAIEPEQLWGPAGLQPRKNPDWKMTPAYRPLGYLTAAMARLRNLPYHCINGENQPQAPPLPGSSDYSEPQPSAAVRIAAKMLARLAGAGKKPLIFITADGYGMGAAMKLMEEQYSYCSLDTGTLSLRRLAGVVYRTLKGAPARIPLYAFPYPENDVASAVETTNSGLDRLLDKIRTNWNKHFRYRGLNLGPFLAYILDTGIRFHLTALQYRQHRLRPLLRSLHPGIVITPFSSGIYALMGETAREMDIPSMVITHGSHLPPRNRIEEIEQQRLTANLMLAPHYKYTAAQSPWAARHAQYFNQQHRTFNTGPILFAATSQSSRDHLRRQLGFPEDAAVIVYAVAQRKRSSVRFHVYETEDEYLQDMTDLVNAVNQMENTWLILKLHPSSEFSDADMRTVLPESQRLHILHREPFQQVLSAADALVSYGSTTIEEALLNGIPVVQYDRWDRYCHIDAFDCNHVPVNEWQVSAAYYVTQPERLKTVLEHALAHANEAGQNPRLYDKHLFRSGQFMTLSHYLKKCLRRPGGHFY